MFHLTWGSKKVPIFFIPCHHRKGLVMLLMSKCFRLFDVGRWNRAIGDPAPIHIFIASKILPSHAIHLPCSTTPVGGMFHIGFAEAWWHRIPIYFNCPIVTPSRIEAILGVLDLAYRSPGAVGTAPQIRQAAWQQ